MEPVSSAGCGLFSSRGINVSLLIASDMTLNATSCQSKANQFPLPFTKMNIDTFMDLASTKTVHQISKLSFPKREPDSNFAHPKPKFTWGSRMNDSN